MILDRYFNFMTKRFSALDAVETGVAMAMAGPVLAGAAPFVNGIVEGGSISGMLPENLMEKGKSAFTSLTQGEMGGRLGSKVNDLVSSLRGGLLGQNIPNPGGFMDKMGEAGLGANLFPDGFKLPGGHALEGGLNRLKQDVGGFIGR